MSQAAVTDSRWATVPERDHFVQFYESDACLLEAMAGFIAGGLTRGDGAVVIATPEHRAQLAEHLAASGVDTATPMAVGRYVVLDAAETLANFMVNGEPDYARFRAVIGPVVAQVGTAPDKSRRLVRAFGEMVAILWKEGNRAAAVQLEQHWNRLGEELAFCLFCGYPLNDCALPEHAEHFGHVCAGHTHVIPGESFTNAKTPQEQARLVAQLQQQAAALKGEISARRAVEAELRMRERELSDFIENANEGMHRVGADGTILWANRAELEMLGYAREEYVGHKVGEFHADQENCREILRRLKDGETLHNHPARLRCKDGSVRHVLINSTTFRENGEFVYTRCFTRDVTAEVMARAEAGAAQQRLATILDLLPAAVYACDREGRIIYFNKMAEKLWGYRPEIPSDQMKFCACYKVYHNGQYLRPEETPMALAVRDGQAFRNLEPEFERADGTRIHACVNIDPLYDARGNLDGAVNVFQDIGEIVAARETLRAHSELLAKAVEERTMELAQTHEKLRLGERMAALGTLSAGLGHDIGNLLLPVGVAVEALRRSGLPAKLSGEVETIASSTEYLRQLAAGLRMLAVDPSREHGDEAIELREWWKTACSVLKATLPRGVELEGSFPNGLRVSMTRPALAQAVFNLVQNAGEALRPRGRGRVRVSAADRGTGMVDLTVSDDGPGMTEEVRRRCMEPFFTTKTRGISTGLGLSLVCGLVREAGGTVDVRSGVGEGTAFVLTLPAGQEEAKVQVYIDVSDARRRAVLRAEAQAQGAVLVDDAQRAQLVVIDDATRAGSVAGRGRRVLLMGGDPQSAQTGVAVLGAAANPAEVRSALVEALRASQSGQGS
ncbi:MAG TPA: PAS domain S-box protein [Phycisphaerales bacterium]|nr:PAS domain S-box protein [Phycisphaerales bacterium]